MHRGQGSFDQGWYAYFQACQTEVKVHQRVDKRVEHNKDPNGGTLVSDTTPHTHHGTSMVVTLQKTRWPTFQQNDDSINDLVKLGDVEPPAKQSQVLVSGCLLKDTTFQVAYSVNEIYQNTFGVGLDQNLADCSGKGRQHSKKSPHGVGAEKDIVQENKKLEQAESCNAVGGRFQSFQFLLTQLFGLLLRQVSLFQLSSSHDWVDEMNRCEVDDSDCQWGRYFHGRLEDLGQLITLKRRGWHPCFK